MGARKGKPIACFNLLTNITLGPENLGEKGPKLSGRGRTLEKGGRREKKKIKEKEPP